MISQYSANNWFYKIIIIACDPCVYTRFFFVNCKIFKRLKNYLEKVFNIRNFFIIKRTLIQITPLWIVTIIIIIIIIPIITN